MRVLVIFSLTALITSCAPLTNSIPKQGPVIIDVELSDFARRFKHDIGVSAEGINLVFGPLEGNTVGECSIHGNNKTITIVRSFWDSHNDYEREQLMYHELGHCAMGLGHDDAVRTDDGCPISVMNSHTLGGCYQTHRADYLDDLEKRK